MGEFPGYLNDGPAEDRLIGYGCIQSITERSKGKGDMPVKVLENIFWVGAVDWNVRNFHGFTYSTHRGTTYNAYLILDEKIALVDSVYGPFAKQLIDKISAIIDPSKIDYVVANHVETDHSGAISEVLKL